MADITEENVARCKVKLDFGGNYEAWWKQMRVILRKKGLEHVHQMEMRRPEDQDKSTEASLLICSNVQTRLPPRVPAQDLLIAPRLLVHLRRMCTPFRLLDLPAELRMRIYEMDIDENNFRTDDFPAIYSYFCRPKIAQLPSLSRVCRQVRTEYLSLFASATTFRLVMPDCEDEVKALKINKLVRSWAKNNVEAYVRQIRDVNFCIYPLSCASLTFTEQHGLKVHFSNVDNEHEGVHNEEYHERLYKYISGIEEDRKALHLKGESIILAMIRDPLIWVYGGSDKN